MWKLDAATLKVIARGTVRGSLQDLAVSRDESEMYVASENGLVDVFDGSTLRQITSIPLDGMAPFGLALTLDDAQLYVTSPLSGQVAIIDRATRAVLRTLRVSGLPRRVAFDVTGAVAVVANEGNWVDVIR